MISINCSNWRRYRMKHGVLCIPRDRQGDCRWISEHTPHISIPVTRETAAEGLRLHRKGQA